MRTRLPLACVALLAGCTIDTAEPERLVGATGEALTADVTPLPTLTWDELGISSRDAGYSARFGDVSAWVFGDTIKEVPTADGSTLSNSWSWTEDASGRGGIGPFQQATDANGAPLPVLPYDPAGYEIAYNALHECLDAAANCRCLASDDECGDRFALWPGPVVTYEDNAGTTRALFLYTELFVGRAKYDYRVRGTSIARWDDPRTQATRTGTAIFGPDDPQMSAGAITYTAGGVEYLYVYTCVPSGTLMADCRVGRAPFVRDAGADALSAILDRQRYRFYVGGDPDAPGSWNASIDNAAVVLRANTTLSVQPNAYLRSLTVVYAQFLTNHVYLQTAPRPEGPWSGHPSVPLFDVTEGDGPVDYYAIVHAEYDASRGRRVYITTSHPDPTDDFVMPTRLFEVVLTR